jgi:hypothetical protein
MARPSDSFSKPAGARISRRTLLGVVAVGVGIVAGLSLYDRFLNVRDATKESGANAIAGPPCPTITPEAIAREGLQTRYSSDFNGLTLGRRFGEVSCAEVAAGGGFGVKSYPVCQFSGPDVLTVKTDKGLLYFRPGVGRRASILTDKGAPRCVMSAPDWAGGV